MNLMKNQCSYWRIVDDSIITISPSSDTQNCIFVMLHFSNLSSGFFLHCTTDQSKKSIPMGMLYGLCLLVHVMIFCQLPVLTDWYYLWWLHFFTFVWAYYRRIFLQFCHLHILELTLFIYKQMEGDLSRCLGWLC